MRASIPFLFACVVSAQDPADLFTSAPPAVDQALRERITKFFQAQSEGRFRVADQYVHEDSKDIFFEADKRRCHSFEIARINYTESFQRATAMVTCETDLLLARTGLVKVKMPLTSFWKVSDGQWWWYMTPVKSRTTPFGEMKPGPPADGAQASPVRKGPSMADILNMVRADRNEVRISAATQAVESVIITSLLPGEMRLQLEPKSVPDLKIELDRTLLKEKETATLAIRYQPDKDRPRAIGSTEEIRLTAQPVSRTLAVRVVFTR